MIAYLKFMRVRQPFASWVTHCLALLNIISLFVNFTVRFNALSVTLAIVSSVLFAIHYCGMYMMYRKSPTRTRSGPPGRMPSVPAPEARPRSN